MLLNKAPVKAVTALSQFYSFFSSSITMDIKRLDIYRKIPKDLTQPTTTGAIVSICCVCFICCMLLTELMWFISPDIRSELHVENNNPTDRIPVRLNISMTK
jgi:hypothetical protein